MIYHPYDISTGGMVMTDDVHEHTSWQPSCTDPRRYFVTSKFWDAAHAVVDDFGNLVRVPS